MRFAYGRHEVLHGLSTQFPVGVSGLMGVNGAGKTTTFRILAGLSAPSSGVISLNGRPVNSRGDRSRHRSQVGYLPQSPRWYPESTVHELLTYFATSRMGRSGQVGRAVERAMEAADVVDLRDAELGRLSGGQLRRAFLAQAVVHDPPVLILDEPTAGLDPVQRIRLRERVVSLGRTRIVVWATHIIDDLNSMADHAVVMHDGTQLWSGTPDELAALGKPPLGLDAARDAVSDAERGFLRVIADPEVR